MGPSEVHRSRHNISVGKLHLSLVCQILHIFPSLSASFCSESATHILQLSRKQESGRGAERIYLQWLGVAHHALGVCKQIEVNFGECICRA
jgi:hypothetical protein